MDFGETLLAAQRNQQKKASDNACYRTKFEPPKKESKPASKLSANIQKFLAKKEEEERRKQDEARRKRDELLAMRDPKATKKIQKMLKVIKSANKSVLAEAVDTEHTAVTRTGAEQPDQDDYGYESQEAAALYKKMMDKYSKLPEEEKFPAARKTSQKDLDGTRERMRAALQREDEPQPRQRKSRSQNQPEREVTPPPQPEQKADKPKVRRPMPPPIDFSQLLKLAEQKKDEPVAVPVAAKNSVEHEPERPMTKRQKREFEEEQARRAARQRRLAEAEGRPSAGTSKQDRPKVEVEKKSEPTFTRIPKIGDRNTHSNNTSKPSSEPPRKQNYEETRRLEQDRYSSSKTARSDAQRNEYKTNIELKSQNTYRIDKDKSQNKESVKTNRDIDRSRIKYDTDRYNEYSDRSRNKDSERGRTERPEKNRTSHSADRNKVNREPERKEISSSKEDIKSRRGRQDDEPKLGRVENKQNGSSNISQNKPTIKQEQLRKSDLKEKALSKEKALFGTAKIPAKLNGASRSELNTTDRSRESMHKVSKPVLNDRRPATNNDKRSPTNNDRRIPTDNDRRLPTNNYKRPPTNNDRRPPTNDRRPPTNDRRLQTNNDRRPQTNNDRRPPTNNDRRPPTNNDRRPPTTNDRRPPTTNDRRPPTTNDRPPTNNDRRQPTNSDRRPPTNNDRMSSANNVHSKPPNKLESKSFDFDKHVSSLKKVPDRGSPGGSGRQSAPGDVRRKFPPGDPRGRNSAPKRRIVDSESEYDSEMDDFIDDGDEEVNYSAAIRDIFGYDRNKYRDIDEDDAAMESSFAQQMREEYISKKIGIMEDLEDMRMEAMEKKRAKKRRRISDDDD